MTDIVRDEGVRSGDPRIEGTRISVLDVERRVIDDDQDPHVVAGEYGVSMAELFTALAYYYEHRDSLGQREDEYEAARREGEHETRERLVPSGDRAEQAE